MIDQKLFDVDKPQHAAPVQQLRIADAGRRGRARLRDVRLAGHRRASTPRSGRVLWTRRDLECNHFRGAGSSPILFRGLLIMHFDGSDVQYVVALDTRTGRTVWKRPRSIDFRDIEPDGRPKADGDFRKAFSTPQIVRVAGASDVCSATDRKPPMPTTR